MIKAKTIIFFDGDGTIWYPRETKKEKAPHWIYSDKQIGNAYVDHLIVIPKAIATLKKLKKMGYFLVLISTHPYSIKESNFQLERKIKHLKLESLFNEFYVSKDYQEGKGEKIVEILKKKHIFKSKALMIGDSYRYDYLSAKRFGIDALLIKSSYMKYPLRGKRIQNVVRGIEDLIEILGQY